MKTKLLLVLIIISSIAFILPGCSKSCPDIGSSAPDFTLETTDGGSLSLSDFQGKIVILNFWATWCVPCQSEMPHFQAVHNEHSGKGVALLSIDIQESPSQVKEFADSNGLTFPLLLDRQAEVAQKYCLPSALPITLFIDAEGIIRARKVGAFRNKGEIESLIDAL